MVVLMYLIIKHTFGQGKRETVKTFGDDEEEAAKEYCEDLKVEALTEPRTEPQYWYELKKL